MGGRWGRRGRNGVALESSCRAAATFQCPRCPQGPGLGATKGGLVPQAAKQVAWMSALSHPPLFFFP